MWMKKIFVIACCLVAMVACTNYDTPATEPKQQHTEAVNELIHQALSVGQHLNKGQEMGYFQFGGSDIIMIFQKGTAVEIVHKGDHLLMGEAYATLKKLF